MIIFAAFVAVVFIAYILAQIIDWIIFNHQAKEDMGCIKLSLQQLIDFYYVNPNRFGFDDRHLFARDKKRVDYARRDYYPSKYQIRLSFLDYQKFKKKIRLYEKRQTKKQEMKDTLKLLELVSADIDNLKNQADKEVSNARKELETIASRIEVMW